MLTILLQLGVAEARRSRSKSKDAPGLSDAAFIISLILLLLMLPVLFRILQRTCTRENYTRASRSLQEDCCGFFQPPPARPRRSEAND
jgi:hypothetical protein